MSEPSSQPENDQGPEPAEETRLGAGSRDPRTTLPEEADSSAMLAELDALLERMMALPVSQVEESKAPLRRTETPPPDIPIITVTEAVPQTLLVPPAPPVSTASDDLYFRALLAEHAAEETEPTRLPEPVAVHRDPAPSPVPRPLPASREGPGSPPDPDGRPDESDDTPLLLPLVLCNRGFDRITSRLGPVGRWLSGPAGRALLGWSGVAMLLVVAGLALCDCLGWTW